VLRLDEETPPFLICDVLALESPIVQLRLNSALLAADDTCFSPWRAPHDERLHPATADHHPPAL